MRVLRARLYELERESRRRSSTRTRRAQIGTGERAEKIRTYNFPENRVTDHRIKLTQHQLDRILEGDLDEFTEALTRRGPAPRARGMTVTVRDLLDAAGRLAGARGRDAARRRRVARRARARGVARRALRRSPSGRSPRSSAAPSRCSCAARDAGAARVRPRRMGLPPADADDRRARARPAARDGDRRRALLALLDGLERAARPRRRRRLGRDRARARGRAARRTGDGRRLLGRCARARRENAARAPSRRRVPASRVLEAAPGAGTSSSPTRPTSTRSTGSSRSSASSRRWRSSAPAYTRGSAQRADALPRARGRRRPGGAGRRTLEAAGYRDVAVTRDLAGNRPRVVEGACE